MIWRGIPRFSGAARNACRAKRAPVGTEASCEQLNVNSFRGRGLRPHSAAVSGSLYSCLHIVLNQTYRTEKRFFSSQTLVDLPVGGTVEVPLAQTGEGIAECELLKWFVKEGDLVEEFQPLCEVQSDKATIEITSRYKGRVSNILYDSGDIVKVGETLLKMIVVESQSSVAPSDDFEITVSSSPDTCAASSQKVLLSEHTGGGVLATPAVRNLAKEIGINIDVVHGTGKDGRILKEDVHNYAARRGMGEQPTVLSAEKLEEKSLNELTEDACQFRDKILPLRGFQRGMVKSMTSAAKVPHFHYLEEINCNALVDLKKAFQSENSDPDVKHTYLPFLLKSLSMALSKHSLLNSSFSEESYEVILKGSHNIGVAMATPYGLVVPNIKRVQSLSILQITKELSRLQLLAVNNKLSSEDISGGTVTLSNIGAVGGKFGSPLLNLPEVAIIAIGRIQKVPRFADDGSIYPASIVNVCKLIHNIWLIIMIASNYEDPVNSTQERLNHIESGDFLSFSFFYKKNF